MLCSVWSTHTWVLNPLNRWSRIICFSWRKGVNKSNINFGIHIYYRRCFIPILPCLTRVIASSFHEPWSDNYHRNTHTARTRLAPKRRCGCDRFGGIQSGRLKRGVWVIRDDTITSTCDLPHRPHMVLQYQLHICVCSFKIHPMLGSTANTKYLWRNICCGHIHNDRIIYGVSGSWFNCWTFIKTGNLKRHHGHRRPGAKSAPGHQ